MNGRKKNTPCFAHLLPDMHSEDFDCEKFAAAAHAQIRTLGQGLSAIGELMYFAARDEQNTITPEVASNLGCFIRNIGEQIDDLIDMQVDAAECAAQFRKEA